MDNRELLKGMLQDIINGKEEQAAVSMHDYFVSKTREVAGLAQAASLENEERLNSAEMPEFDSEEETSDE